MVINVEKMDKKGEPMGRLWGTLEWVPHTETPVNKGKGGM